MQIDFISGAYEARSKLIDAQECVNLYPEIEQASSKNVKALIGVPGLTRVSGRITTGFIRGMYYNELSSATFDYKVMTCVHEGNVFFLDYVDERRYEFLRVDTVSDANTIVTNDAVLRINDVFNIDGMTDGVNLVDYTVTSSTPNGTVVFTPALSDLVIPVNKRVYLKSTTEGLVLNEYYAEPSTIVDTGKIAKIASNGIQNIICQGGKSYCLSFKAAVSNGDITYDIADIAEIAEIEDATHVIFLDGYFFANRSANRGGNGEFGWCSLYDGTKWALVDGGGFATAESNSDELLAILKVNNQAYMFGSRTIEVWYPSGDPNLPLYRNNSATIEIGLQARYSAVTDGKSAFWLGASESGSGVVWMTNGYTPQRISTPAIEYQISEMTVTSDAIGHIYQQEGHLFYVLQFPYEDQTWVYDVSTGYWHRRGEYDEDQTLVAYRGYVSAQVGNYVFVGDSKSGNTIYISDLNSYKIDYLTNSIFNTTRTLPAIRTTPHISDENKWLFHQLFELDMEKGLDFTNVSMDIVGDSLGNFTIYPYYNTLYGANLSATYYWEFTKVGATVTLNVYSDSAGQNLVGTESKNYNTDFFNITLSDGNGVLYIYYSYKGDDIDIPNNKFDVNVRGAQIMLQWSDDGGFTWSNEYWRDAGINALGQYRKRLRWQRLGKSRDRIYRVKMTDAAKRVFVNAYLGVTA